VTLTTNSSTYGQHPSTVVPSTDPLPDEPRTELGYAHRFVDAYGDRVRFVATWSAGHQWLVWDGRRWAGDTTGQAKRWMKAISRSVTAHCLTIEDDSERKEAIKEAKRGESNSAVNGALSLAAIDAQVVVDHEDLDAYPWLLNCGNGTLDLRTGQLSRHDPDQLLTKLAGADYRPDATGSTFVRFLADIQPDAGMRAFLARLLGHALPGTLIEHVLPIFWGDGANGKSTLLDAVLAALGDYAGMAAPGLLTARSNESHPTEIADLFGLRLARLDETDENRRLAEGTVKRLTGDRRQKARRMRENFWEFDASHTFVMLTNHKPLVTGNDEGIWRRLQLVPFAVVIPEDQRDEHLPDKLAAELDAVLAWLVEGCTTWQAGGLDAPDTVTAATAAYRAESDDVGRFLNECCVITPSARVQGPALYQEWTSWCAAEGTEPGSPKAFATGIQNRGFDASKTRGVRVWHGLGLTTLRGEPDGDDNPGGGQ